MNIGRLRFFPLRRAKKAGDDDLALFRELFKRERETNKSLLEEASTEFEPFYGISVDVHKIPTAKKCDDLGNEIQKNEHDWLKTSPETPPFRPPEMDFAQPSNPSMVVQKELPLIPPLKPSRVKRKVPGPLKFTSSHRETPFPNSDSDSDSNPDQPSLPRLDRAPRFVNKEFSSTIESVKEAMFVNSHENRQARISSRPETPEEDPNPLSLPRYSGGKADPNPKQSKKEATGKQKTEPMTQTLKVKVQLKPDTRKPPPDMKDPNPELKIKPVKRTEQVTAAKRNKEVKPHNKTVSPVANSRFPERRANSATRLRETAPATGLVERRRSTSVAKCQAAEHEKGGGRRGELGSVGSTVEKNIKPRRSTATRATASREEKASKFRWV